MTTTSNRLYLAYKLLLALADEAESADASDQQEVSLLKTTEPTSEIPPTPQIGKKSSPQSAGRRRGRK